ncbi:MAG: hypothetical protein LBU14_00045 [Candidatus Peribacteria bacterium]|nr:hypothetical protein [Candidatus Peribacteria bacterium]
MLVSIILKSFSSHSFTEVNPFTCNVAVSSIIGPVVFVTAQVKWLLSTLFIQPEPISQNS